MWEDCGPVRGSTHPDWDEAYAAGTPVAVIAERAGARLGTVYRHLEGRRQLDPSLAASRAKAAKGPGLVWLKRLAQTRDFVAKHGRYPSTGRTADSEERRAALWLTDQRAALVQQTLGWEKMREMTGLGDWTVPPHERELDTHWAEQLAAVVKFVAEYNREPSSRRHDVDAWEHTLGLWLVTQNVHANDGRLNASRVSELDGAVPSWRGRRGKL